MSLNHEDVVRILELLDASHFDELRIETAGYKLHLRRSASGAAPETGNEAGAIAAVAATQTAEARAALAAPATPAASVPPSGTHAASAPNAANAPLATPSIPPPASPATDAARATTAVKAPMLGTFYGAPQPGAAPFVTVGSTVAPDTVIGIVEVMKLMNAVSAGTSGVVVEIVAKDGTLVEYGEVLLRVAPAAS